MPVVDPKQIIAAREVVNSIYIDDRVKDYIVDVVWATREPAAYNLRLEGLIRYGPRHVRRFIWRSARGRTRF